MKKLYTRATLLAVALLAMPFQQMGGGELER